MYFFIFFGKILEVSISTIRVVLISRGERTKGAIAALFEYTLWIFVTCSVITGFQEDLLKVAVLIAAFAVGTFFGSWLEEKLAFGLCTISVVFSSLDEANDVARLLRKDGHAITILKAEGLSHEMRHMFTLTIRRKFVPRVISLIQKSSQHAVITVANVSSCKGGYMKKVKATALTSLFPFTNSKKRTKGECNDA